MTRLYKHLTEHQGTGGFAADKLNEPALQSLIQTACRRIAPLWPLQHFVAVNPFLGLSEQRFTQAAETMQRVAGARMTLPTSFYQEQLAQGRITDSDLQAALQQALLDHTAAQLGLAEDLPTAIQQLRAFAAQPEAAVAASTLSFADVLDQTQGSQWSALAKEEISKWCAAYFDRGQASLVMPWRDQPLFAAWRAAALLDQTPRVAGLDGWHAAIAQLPADPVPAIAQTLAALGLPRTLLDDYLHCVLLSVGGWASYARYCGWDKGLGLAGESDDTLMQLLAVRLAWDYALFASCTDAAAQQAWGAYLQGKQSEALEPSAGAAALRGLRLNLILQQAFEQAFQRSLLVQISSKPVTTHSKAPRKAVQAAFCIDVRSEILRRAVEQVSIDVETIGFAGFFGFPIEYVPLGHTHGGKQCPVLLQPKFRIRESIAQGTAEEEAEAIALRGLRKWLNRSWKTFKLSAVSCFSYVETVGLAFAAKLMSDSFKLTRTVQQPVTDGLEGEFLGRLVPQIEHEERNGLTSGFTPDERVAMAEAVLRAMSLTDNFARIVLLCGHGSTTVNNPQATGLDCGACGGHTGEANARVAAAVLNDPWVRTGLAIRGIALPADTLFVPALHDTTTDEVRLFDTTTLPESHLADLKQLQAWLAEAAQLARQNRMPLLGVSAGPAAHAQVIERSRDWSQVRPEWGLAGNAAFIAAPRTRTQGLNLGGRAFLHSYEWTQDKEFKVLELIMTAPMVVANWINLQYYGSTVDNAKFGSGNKVLHNVVGTLGVLQGQGGDLQTGLPWQSVHDGKRFVHEPLRLNVFIEAPRDEINKVIARHANVRELLDNGWLHLFCIAEEGKRIERYLGELHWEPAVQN